jgi:hypothetical protein
VFGWILAIFMVATVAFALSLQFVIERLRGLGRLFQRGVDRNKGLWETVRAPARERWQNLTDNPLFWVRKGEAGVIDVEAQGGRRP